MEGLFVGEESRREGLLEGRDAAEGSYVGNVEVGEAHFEGLSFFRSGVGLV